jgi:hypothetical protein
MELLSLRKIRRIWPQHRGPGPPAPAHGSTDFIKRRSLASGSMARIESCEPVPQLLISVVHRRNDGWGGGSTEFEFSWATVVGFRWGLLLRDHIGKGNVFMLTLIGGEQQRSLATVRRLGRCLSTVRTASGEASAPRTCAKASSTSLLASRPSNCSDRWWKTRIWWLPKVRWVLGLRPKIRTICGTIYRGF